MAANYETTQVLTNRFYDLILDSGCTVDFKGCCEYVIAEPFYAACNDDQIRAAFIRATSKAAAEHAANYYETHAENRTDMITPHDFFMWLESTTTENQMANIPRPVKQIAVNDILGDGLKAEVVDVQQIADNRSVVICLLGPDNPSNFVVWTALHADGRWTVHNGYYVDSLSTAIDCQKKRVAEQNNFLYG